MKADFWIHFSYLFIIQRKKKVLYLAYLICVRYLGKRGFFEKFKGFLEWILPPNRYENISKLLTNVEIQFKIRFYFYDSILLLSFWAIYICISITKNFVWLRNFWIIKCFSFTIQIIFYIFYMYLNVIMVTKSGFQNLNLQI